MHSQTLYRWTLLGAFAATAALMGPGCNRDKPMIPREGSRYEGTVNTQQPGEPSAPMPPPATGGSGQQGTGTTAAQDGAGAQGQTNKIGAPGFTTPQEPTRDPGGTQQFIQGHQDKE
ncbi:hypothetical protein [Corallococcus llansteffanensis]|uniref:Lipoprotein n=1 Tax=Corallococcus llansteffanensis TaxID=2316731 RepID=A0A3A8PTM4_9BACT|nr:hypothetical protein [Corallococcus llansteffanensis]RKH59328.1 hypothetical protein D7V93_15060 [Corallococcus llansteffanensis]